MNYEVHLLDERWVVRRDGIEEAQFGLQADALAYVQSSLREHPAEIWASLSLNFKQPQ